MKQQQQKQQLDKAWLHMQDRLRQEPDHTNWSAFTARARQAEVAAAARELNPNPSPLHHTIAKASGQLQTSSDVQNVTRKTLSNWLLRRRRSLAAAAVVLLLSVTLATPAGNEAFAALLNQFRMEKLTAVENQDLRNLFNSVGLTESAMNQYGEFASFSDGEPVSFATIKDLQAHLDRELVLPTSFRTEQHLRITVSPTRTITMKVNVANINKAMRELGASTLLPLSIDGKQLKLTLGQKVTIDFLSGETQQASYTLSQRPAPSLVVEDGVPMAEALEAVLQFPLIPTQLKQELQQALILNNGSVPLPIIMPDSYEQAELASTSVLWIRPNAAEGRYAAIWLKDGQLFTFSGIFSDPEAFTSRLKEVVSP